MPVIRGNDLTHLPLATAAIDWLSFLTCTPAALTLIMVLQTGDVYEASGVDAVMVVEHARVNPIGNPSTAVPRAQFVKSNLDFVQRKLLDVGLSMVRCATGGPTCIHASD